MQTIERPPETQAKSRGRPPWLPFVLPPVIIAFAGILVVAILNKWAVLLLTIVAVLAGLGVWTWNRGFKAIEIVPFLIHFDGLGYKIISIGRVSAAVLTVVILHKLLVKRWRPPAVPWKNWAPIWLLFSWVTLSGIWSHRPGGWIKAFLMLYLAFVFFCLTSMLVESHKDVQRFLRAFWVGGLVGSATGILALGLGTRSEGLIGDPNFFGLVEAAMIPLTVYYYRHTNDMRERWLYGLTLALVLAGAAGAGSRSGLIGASIAIVATLVSRPGISTVKRARTAGIALLIAPIAFGIGFVLNPINVQRGFSDRGAGRLDFWNVTTDIIGERPMIGQGLGQLQYEIPQRLLITPGVKMLEEKRETVSSHNTWFDVLGDVGLIGVALFALCFIMAAWSLLRPRWPYTSDLSTTILVMLLPVLSSSLFLPLLNNKLGWSIVGLAAALHVRSDDSRWDGLTGDGQQSGSEIERSRVGSSSEPAITDHSDAGSEIVPYGTPLNRTFLPVRQQEVLANPLQVDSMPDLKLARWDLRIRRSVLWWTATAGLVAAICAYVYGSSLPLSFEATSGFVAPELDVSFPRETFRLPIDRSQQALALVASQVYAQNLQNLSGIDRSVEEITGHISVEKPKMGGMVKITFRDRERKVVEQAAPYLIAAINDIYTSARQYGAAGVNDQARPINPGEQSYYSGPPLIVVFTEPLIQVVEPKVIWITLVGGMAGSIFMFGLLLSGCTRPRIRSDDDFVSHVGTTVWTHVSRSTREPIDSEVAQVQQLAVTLLETVPPELPLRRILVSPSERSRDGRGLTVDLAAALVSRGERVVIVDADVERPWMALRLNPRGRRAAKGEPLDLQAVHIRTMSKRARRLIGGRIDELRLVRGSQLLRTDGRYLDAQRLGDFDDGVTVIVLAPPPTSDVGISSLAEWAQATVIPLRVGQTTTSAAQLATSRIRLLGRSRNGIVLVNS